MPYFGARIALVYASDRFPSFKKFSIFSDNSTILELTALEVAGGGGGVVMFTGSFCLEEVLGGGSGGGMFPGNFCLEEKVSER
ncbi:6366_t:CDS:2 [Ambispora gerdemannii]|uniref:6366_t:CDS:1 n=1 Tax=Ambispora gerdemannii TaxID=144530 RepID=A0A9N9H6Z2_9GLOM|nr:6366_t:CDS:2 [Ambispora gerdemannii]